MGLLKSRARRVAEAPAQDETRAETAASPEVERLALKIADARTRLEAAAAEQDFNAAARIKSEIAGLERRREKAEAKARRRAARERERAGRRAAKARGRADEGDGASGDAVGFVRDANGPQRLVPYEKLFRDGIMDLGGGRWSVSVTYDDTNYTLTRDETKAAINRSYRDWLDSFNESEPFQMTFRVGRVDKRTFERDFEHPSVPGDDAGNAYREELNAYVRDKLTSASASMRHERVMTFTCRADTHEAAARHFASTIKTFDRFLRKYKCSHRRLSGQARMDLINSITKPDDEPGKYRFDDIAGDASITSRDLVCPWRVWRPDEGRDDSRLVVGGRWVRSYSVLPTDGGWGPNVRDTLLSDLSGLGHDLVITVHVAPWETHEAARIAKAKYLDIADENASYKVNRSRPQQGYFIDDTNMPRQMYEAERGADLTREQLEHNQQHMFATCLIVTAFGRTEEELEDACHDIEQTFQVHSKPGLESWVCLREQCYASMLPLGVNLVPYSRNVLTKPLSMLVPFMSAEFSDPRGSLLGVNADTNNLIMYDRTAREHTNAMILGQSKGGKSVFCKLMMLQTFLNDPQSDQIILDPEGEYVAGVECLGQQVIKISESSADHVNPLDISPYYASTEPTLETNPLPAKVAFVQSLVQKMSHEITDEERNAIDVACARIYEPWLVSRDDADIPTLSDLTDALRSDESERRRASLHAAELLYTFVDGTSNIFNNPTNVDLHARIVDFSLVDMSDKLKPIAMLVLLDQIWVRVTRNRNEGRRTYLWIDEMQILIDDPYALHTLDVFWSRGRKWDLYNGAITQSAERVENISETSYMMANSPFVVLMKQHPDYATALAETYGLSEDQRDILESTSPGEGIAVIDNQPVHFDFSIDREAYPTLYRYVTTTPDDLRAERTRRFSERLSAARAETEEDEGARTVPEPAEDVLAGAWERAQAARRAAEVPGGDWVAAEVAPVPVAADVPGEHSPEDGDPTAATPASSPFAYDEPPLDDLPLDEPDGEGGDELPSEVSPGWWQSHMRGSE